MFERSVTDEATDVFMDHRELLFGLVYNMLGSVADTEDVLQETWLSWSGRGAAGVANPRAYLVRIAVNHALQRRASITRRRETYVGPWLPEPLVADDANADDPALRSESVSMAMLVVLESLTPLERAVFVLNEVFGYAHTEIAEIIDRTPRRYGSSRTARAAMSMPGGRCTRRIRGYGGRRPSGSCGPRSAGTSPR